MVSSYGIIESSSSDHGVYLVDAFLEKPQATETTSRLGVIGKYIITPEVFDYIEQSAGTTSKDGEIRLADAFAKMSVDRDIYGLELEGSRYDTGDKF